MSLPSLRNALLPLFAVCALPAACPAGGGEGEGEGEGEGRTTFSWEARDDVNVPFLWGAIVSDGPTPDEAFVVGGVVDDLGPVITDIQNVAVINDRVRSSSTTATDVPRFCGCAMFDAGRNELVVVGGRNGSFIDVETAFVLDVDSGERTEIADPNGDGPAQHPIGCQAFFVDGVDQGVVFSGLSSNDGEFGADTFVYDPAARSFSVVDVEGGPAPRYDASVHHLDDNSFLMVGGMGANNLGVVFFSEVWSFNASTTTWTELPPSNTAPPGRRYPWAALSVDDDTLLYGYGSDSPVGDSVLSDLWRFTLSTGAWDEVVVDNAADAPAPRGFVYRLPGPSGTAGTMVGGLGDGQVATPDAFVLRVPDEFGGVWR